MAQMDLEGNPSGLDAINDFDIAMCDLDEDYCILASPDKGGLRSRSRSFHGNRPRQDSQQSRNKNFSSTRKSSLSINESG